MDIGDPSQIEIVGERALLPVVPTATVPSAGIVPWQDAGQYIGQRVTVEGDVVRSYNSGKVSFLNFAQDYKGTFSVVVFASDYAKWPQTPDQFYLGQKIRATGKVKEYQGAPEMIVETPEQIEVVGPSETVARCASEVARGHAKGSRGAGAEGVGGGLVGGSSAL